MLKAAAASVDELREMPRQAAINIAVRVLLLSWRHPESGPETPAPLTATEATASPLPVPLPLARDGAATEPPALAHCGAHPVAALLPAHGARGDLAYGAAAMFPAPPPALRARGGLAAAAADAPSTHGASPSPALEVGGGGRPAPETQSTAAAEANRGPASEVVAPPLALRARGGPAPGAATASTTSTRGGAAAAPGESPPPPALGPGGGGKGAREGRAAAFDGVHGAPASGAAPPPPASTRGGAAAHGASPSPAPGAGGVSASRAAIAPTAPARGGAAHGSPPSPALGTGGGGRCARGARAATAGPAAGPAGPPPHIGLPAFGAGGGGRRTFISIIGDGLCVLISSLAWNFGGNFREAPSFAALWKKDQPGHSLGAQLFLAARTGVTFPHGVLQTLYIPIRAALDDSSFSRESIGDQDDNVEGIIDFRVATVKFLQSLTVLLARLDPTYSNSHAPRLQPPSSTPLRSGGLPLWATAPSPEPGLRGRTKPRPATPAPKPRLTSPSAFQQNIGTRKMTRERRNMKMT